MDTADAVITGILVAFLLLSPLFGLGWPKRAVRITFRVGNPPGGAR